MPAYRRRFADKYARRLETVANLRPTERRPFVGSVLVRWVQLLVHDTEAISFIVRLMLTDHACFGTYLYKVGEANTTECADSVAREDSVHHLTLECPVSAEYRKGAMRNAVHASRRQTLQLGVNRPQIE